MKAGSSVGFRPFYAGMMKKHNAFIRVSSHQVVLIISRPELTPDYMEVRIFSILFLICIISRNFLLGEKKSRNFV